MGPYSFTFCAVFSESVCFRYHSRSPCFAVELVPVQAQVLVLAAQQQALGQVWVRSLPSPLLPLV